MEIIKLSDFDAFFHLKTTFNSQKSLSDTIFFAFGRYQHSKAGKLSKISQKWQKNFKVHKTLHFLSCLGHSGVFGVKQKVHKPLQIHIAW